jgi:transcriptional regulator with XRE-family HTH domain
MQQDDVPNWNNVMSPTETFSFQLTEVRTRKGWTQQQLADRLAELGHPMGRSAISKIEGGTRHVTLDDEAAIAHALGVSPLHLTVPSRPEASVRIAGRAQAVDSIVYARWRRADDTLLLEEPRFFFAGHLEPLVETIIAGRVARMIRNLVRREQDSPRS